jgi:DNA repair ATPase RecN
MTAAKNKKLAADLDKARERIDELQAELESLDDAEVPDDLFAALGELEKKLRASAEALATKRERLESAVSDLETIEMETNALADSLISFAETFST